MAKKRLKVQVSLSPEQKAFLDNLGGNTAKLFRDALRQQHPDFPTDPPFSMRRDYTVNWKMTFMGYMLETCKPMLPATAEALSTACLAEIEATLANGASNKLYQTLLTEGKTILQNDGYKAFMNWFGIIPIWADATRTTVDAFGIKSADED